MTSYFSQPRERQGHSWGFSQQLLHVAVPLNLLPQTSIYFQGCNRGITLDRPFLRLHPYNQLGMRFSCMGSPLKFMLKLSWLRPHWLIPETMLFSKHIPLHENNPNLLYIELPLLKYHSAVTPFGLGSLWGLPRTRPSLRPSQILHLSFPNFLLQPGSLVYWTWFIPSYPHPRNESYLTEAISSRSSVYISPNSKCVFSLKSYNIVRNEPTSWTWNSLMKWPPTRVCEALRRSLRGPWVLRGF